MILAFSGHIHLPRCVLYAELKALLFNFISQCNKIVPGLWSKLHCLFKCLFPADIVYTWWNIWMHNTDLTLDLLYTGQDCCVVEPVRMA